MYPGWSLSLSAASAGVFPFRDAVKMSFRSFLRAKTTSTAEDGERPKYQTLCVCFNDCEEFKVNPVQVLMVINKTVQRFTDNSEITINMILFKYSNVKYIYIRVGFKQTKLSVSATTKWVRESTTMGRVYFG